MSGVHVTDMGTMAPCKHMQACKRQKTKSERVQMQGPGFKMQRKPVAKDQRCEDASVRGVSKGQGDGGGTDLVYLCGSLQACKRQLQARDRDRNRQRAQCGNTCLITLG